ncbi:hypothetical protein ACFPH6_32405 [Streptomyces xiangluensis]|uniref:Uncharacterized protein n=1 Tax=Streptomyces xiangluensis TaxID=2665720 RepID=A0ABV8YX02_9ACTN
MQDVDTAVEVGADAIGFVFSAGPRRIDATTAARLGRRDRSTSCKTPTS